MADDAPAPEADRVGDLPHPRETSGLFGQAAAEAAFLEAWAADRMHHAWLMTGPRGVGKATLAYRMARKRLSEDDGGGLFGAPEAPTSLAMDAEHPVARRVAAGAEPRLAALRRSADPKTGKLYTVIRVDDVRAMKSVFSLSAADGGWRVAIVDPAEEMNPSAANALLKLLEEPPARCLFLLVSHAPQRLLPTIRSRCRTLPMPALGAGDLAAALSSAGVETPKDMTALSALAGGSAGEAARLAGLDGPGLYARIVRLLAGAPGMDRREMTALADACAGRDAAETYDLTIRLIDFAVSRLARAGALGPPSDAAAPDEAAMIARLSTTPHAARTWADIAAKTQGLSTRGRAVNLDPAMVMLDIFFEIDAAARSVRARPV